MPRATRIVAAVGRQVALPSHPPYTPLRPKADEGANCSRNGGGGGGGEDDGGMDATAAVAGPARSVCVVCRCTVAGPRVCAGVSPASAVTMAAGCAPPAGGDGMSQGDGAQDSVGPGVRARLRCLT